MWTLARWSRVRSGYLVSRLAVPSGVPIWETRAKCAAYRFFTRWETILHA